MSVHSFLLSAQRGIGRRKAPPRPMAIDNVNGLMVSVASLLIWAQRHCPADALGPDPRDQKPVDRPSRNVRGRNGVIWVPPAN